MTMSQFLFVSELLTEKFHNFTKVDFFEMWHTGPLKYKYPIILWRNHIWLWAVLVTTVKRKKDDNFVLFLRDLNNHFWWFLPNRGKRLFVLEILEQPGFELLINLSFVMFSGGTAVLITAHTICLNLHIFGLLLMNCSCPSCRVL